MIDKIYIKCPHCGTESFEAEVSDGDGFCQDCENCGKTFQWLVSIKVTIEYDTDA